MIPVSDNKPNFNWETDSIPEYFKDKDNPFEHNYDIEFCCQSLNGKLIFKIFSLNRKTNFIAGHIIISQYGYCLKILPTCGVHFSESDKDYLTDQVDLFYAALND